VLRIVGNQVDRNALQASGVYVKTTVAGRLPFFKSMLDAPSIANRRTVAALLERIGGGEHIRGSSPE
jgi:hypothetical protein